MIDQSRWQTPIPTRKVFVVLDAVFSYQHVLSNGADLRFSPFDTLGSFDLSHYIERWNMWGESRILVSFSAVATSSETYVYMYYGNTQATDGQASFATVFPNSYISTGDASLDGDQLHDWFETKDGYELTVGVQAVIEINARNIIVEGTPDGDGAGYSGGGVGENGGGSGGGSYVSTLTGAGGGGYGGTGGEWGRDSGDSTTPGGGTYGQQDGDQTGRLFGHDRDKSLMSNRP